MAWLGISISNTAVVLRELPYGYDLTASRRPRVAERLESVILQYVAVPDY
jgi:hypothetical protein